MAQQRSEQYEAAIDELSRRFPSGHRGELARFARYQRGNVGKAAAQYEAYLAWSRENLPVQREAIAEVLETGFFQEVPGRALDGSSVALFYGPRFDPKRFSQHDISNCIVYVLTQIFAARERGDWRLSVIFYGPPETPFNLKTVGTIARVVQDNFPETMTNLYFFPVGTMTPFFWRMVKPFLGAEADKVHLLEGSRRPASLKDHISQEAIPLEFLPSADEAAESERRRLAAAAEAPQTISAPLEDSPSPVKKEMSDEIATPSTVDTRSTLQEQAVDWPVSSDVCAVVEIEVDMPATAAPPTSKGLFCGCW